jgi:cell division protein FtsN
MSVWLGLGLGLALGLAVAAVIYLKDRKLDAPGAMDLLKPAKKHSRNDPPDTADATPERPAKNYDFYDMLPKFEVVVPEKDKEVRADVKGVQEPRRGTYELQVGTYKKLADAERVRAQLGLQNIDAKIQKVTVGEDSWNRIRIGPISDLAELNRMRALLRKADYQALIVRVGD